MKETPEERWCTDSFVRGFHIYKEMWAPEEGEMLQCSREIDNVDDKYAVAMMKMATWLAMCHMLYLHLVPFL